MAILDAHRDPESEDFRVKIQKFIRDFADLQQDFVGIVVHSGGCFRREYGQNLSLRSRLSTLCSNVTLNIQDAQTARHIKRLMDDFRRIMTDFRDAVRDETMVVFPIASHYTSETDRRLYTFDKFEVWIAKYLTDSK